MTPADPAIVELYAYIYKAGGPVAFDELADKALAPALRNDSYRAYRVHFETENGFKLPDDGWANDLKRAAWLWWVEHLLRDATRNRWIARLDSDGSTFASPARAARWPYPQSTFVLGSKTPSVLVTRRITVEKIQPWDPERLDDTRKGNAAGRFLSSLNDGREHVAKMRNATGRDALLALLDDAEMAVRNQ